MDCEKEEYLFDPKTLATAAKSEAKEELLFTPVGEGSDDNNRFLLRPLCATDYDYGVWLMISVLYNVSDKTVLWNAFFIYK